MLTLPTMSQVIAWFGWGHISYYARGPWFMRAVQHALIGVAPTVVGFTLGYFQGVWIFIVPLFLLFFGLGYFG